jgi:hypothetical protein
MSSFFDEASLVMIPSGYKDQKVYSVKPLDGSGDLTFSRASSATRVASNGLIEKVRTNLLLQSNTFSSASWNKTNTTLTSGQPDKDGGTNAWRVQFTGGAADSHIFQAITNQLNTGSIFVKGTAGETILFGVRASVGSGTLTTFSGSWQRITDSNATNGFFVISDYNSATATDFLIMNAQVEAGAIATDYIPTTTTAVSVGPVSGLPRLDYLGSTCPRLLLEPQRTNIALFSEQFDNAAHVKTNNTVTANATTSPDGYANADKLIPTATSGFHSVDILPSVIVTTYTLSVFAKAGEYSKIALLTNNRGSNMARGFDLTNGTTFANDFGYTEPTSFAITNYGNGWYRCSITYPKTSTGTSGNGIAVVNDAGATTFAGNGTDGLFVYGFQMESAASYPSSYIPTLSTSVTRLADTAIKTGISSLIGQTEGTVFVEFNSSNVAGSSNTIFGISNGTTLSRALIYLTSNRIDGQLRDAGVTQAGFAGVTMAANTTYKCAIAYKANDVTFYINGTQIGTDTDATIPAMSDVRFDSGGGGIPCDVPISQALVFKTRLTNAQLAELTTL